MIYLAAPLSQVRRVAELARDLSRDLGARIVSTWHLRASDAGDPHSIRVRRRTLDDNRRELRAATLGIVLADAGIPRATLAEAGEMRALDIPYVWWHAPGAGPDHPSRCLYDANAIALVEDYRGLLAAIPRHARNHQETTT